MTANTSVQPLAIVTGAAQRIGGAIALGLAAKGYAIGLHYHHSAAAAQETAREIEKLGAAAILLPADLTDEAQIVEMFRRVDEQPYPLQVLINSASVMARGDVRTMSAAEWDATLALNLRAPWLCAQQAARRMKAGSVIINLTDAGSDRTWTGYPAYIISKSALETLTRVLAKSLAPEIRVNAIAPGLILPGADVRDEDWQRMVSRLPLKRPGSAQSILQAVWYLLEEPYITGQTLVVDGGYRLI
jgi:pteridine reductase